MSAPSRRLFRTSSEVHAFIRTRFGVEFSRSGLIKYLTRLGFEYRKPEAMPAQANVAAREAFIAAYEQLLHQLDADEVVYFGDAVHPEYQSRRAYGRVRKGDKVAVRRTTGRKRINLHGALCLEDFDCQIVEGECISAETTIRLFERLSNRHPYKRKIHVFLDNARYHHAKIVKACLARTDRRIELRFPLAYAPNLNAIEKLWGGMHRHVTISITPRGRIHQKDTKLPLGHPPPKLARHPWCRLRQLPCDQARGFSGPPVKGVYLRVTARRFRTIGVVLCCDHHHHRPCRRPSLHAGWFGGYACQPRLINLPSLLPSP